VSCGERFLVGATQSMGAAYVGQRVAADGEDVGSRKPAKQAN
jgi:hypothetical protein